MVNLFGRTLDLDILRNIIVVIDGVIIDLLLHTDSCYINEYRLVPILRNRNCMVALRAFHRESPGPCSELFLFQIYNGNHERL